MTGITDNKVRAPRDFDYTEEQKALIRNAFGTFDASQRFVDSFNGLEEVLGEFDALIPCSADDAFFLSLKNHCIQFLEESTFFAKDKTNPSNVRNVLIEISELAENLATAIKRAQKLSVTGPFLFPGDGMGIDLVETLTELSQSSIEAIEPQIDYVDHNPFKDNQWRDRFAVWVLERYQLETGKRPKVTQSGPAARALRACLNPVLKYANDLCINELPAEIAENTNAALPLISKFRNKKYEALNE